MLNINLSLPLILTLLISCNSAWSPSPLLLRSSSPSSCSSLFTSVYDDPYERRLARRSARRRSNLTRKFENDRSDVDNRLEHHEEARVSSNIPRRKYHQENFFEENPAFFGNRYQFQANSYDDNDEEFFRDLQQESFNRNYDRHFNTDRDYRPPDYYNEQDFYNGSALSRRFGNRYDNSRYDGHDFETPYDDRRQDYPDRYDHDHELQPIARREPFADFLEEDQRMDRVFGMKTPFFERGRSSLSPLGMFGFPQPFISSGMDELTGIDQSMLIDTLLRDAERSMNENIAYTKELGESIRIGPIFSQSSSSSSMNGQTRQVTRLHAWAQGSERTGSIRLEATERGIEELVLQMEDERGHYRNVHVRASNDTARKPNDSSILDAEFEYDKS